MSGEVAALKKRNMAALAALLCLACLTACRSAAPPSDVAPAPPEEPARSGSEPGSASEPAEAPDSVPGAASGPADTPGTEPGSVSEPAVTSPAGPEPETEPDSEPSPGPVNTKLYVLMYHHIIREGEPYNDWMVTDVRFREDLEWLAGHGYATVLPGELAAGEPLPERAVMLTFDDGYRSNYELAYPLLQEYQAKAVISVIGAYVQQEDPFYLTWDMCREMSRSGLVEIGSHSYAAHDDGGRGIKRREGESREDYEARIFPDLQTSIDLIEEQIGTAPTFFAYPNGKTEEWARDFIRERFAVTVVTRHGSCDTSKGLYGLKRYNVSMKMPPQKFLPK